MIPSASVIPENDPTVLFTTAGMHPLVPYLLGAKHPMGARLTGIDMAKACLDAFLTTEFAGDRHARRVDKLSNPPQLETSR